MDRQRGTVTNYDARGRGSGRLEHTRAASHVGRCAGVEQPVGRARWRRLERETGESLVERRWKGAGRGMLRRHGLLRSGARASAKDTWGRRGVGVGQLWNGPRLNDTCPGVNPRRGRSTRGSTRRAGGRGGGRGLLLALALTSIGAAGATTRGRRSRAATGRRRSGAGGVGVGGSAGGA